MITLTSDFPSPYPAAMRGVLVSRTDARLVDIAHDLPRGDVRVAAFWLREVLPWFPPAVHLVVVDPGVGTDRAALALRAGEHALVGPDNGVLVPAARQLGEIDAFEVEVSEPGSHTFHGRDVFAPAAAAVHDAGVDGMDDLPALSPTRRYEKLEFPEPDLRVDGASGEVLVVDGFGNAITNLPGLVLDGRYGDAMDVNGEDVPIRRSYGMVPAGARLLVVGSHGNVELAVNGGRGDEAFEVEPGDGVELSW